MLKGIKVLQFEGLAPSVFCGMYFADQGAEVVIVARKDPAPLSIPIERNILNRGKQCIVLSLKIKKDIKIIQKLIETSDIIIDPYRPGVLQKLGFGPDFIYKVNKKAILLRVSGYGQSGPLALRPGHDLNYLSVSGIIPLINPKNGVPQFPTNYLADFVSSSLGITATLSALLISKQTGIGRVVDCSLTNGAEYLAQLISNQQSSTQPPTFINEDGQLFCVTFKRRSDGKVTKKQQMDKQCRKIIKSMIDQGKQYFCDEDVEVSKVKELCSFKDQAQKLTNPFGKNPLNTLIIPSLNQHEALILDRLQKMNEPRSKL